MKSRLFSRLVLLVAVVVAAAALISTGVRYKFLVPSTPPPAHASLPPSAASYLGVYEAGAPPGYAPIAGFAKAAGKQPNLVGYYSGWAEPFARSFAEQVRAHGGIPFVQIDPTLASVSKIAAGAYDLYLRQYADSVRSFRHAVVIGFGHEMNTTRYSWGYGHVRPSVFVAAWRHIVNVFRGQGADNVTWLWTVNQDAPGTGPVAGLVAGSELRHLGRHRWLLLPARPTRSPPSSAPPSPTCGSSPTSPSCCRRPRWGQAPASSPRSATCSTGCAGTRRSGWCGSTSPRRASIFHQDWRIESSQSATTAFRLGVSALTLARPSR